jgi:hypothetical protein
VDWPTHENHENSCPTNNNDFTVLNRDVPSLASLRNVKSFFSWIKNQIRLICFDTCHIIYMNKECMEIVKIYIISIGLYYDIKCNQSLPYGKATTF